MSNPGLPMKPRTSSPNKSEKPISMNTTVPIQKSMRFFIRMLPVFFALVKPASTIAKPACIQNTNAAPIRNQTPKITPLISSVIVMSSLSCFFFHFFILSKIKFIKKIETLHQFPQLRGSAKCLHFIIMLN